MNPSTEVEIFDSKEEFIGRDYLQVLPNAGDIFEFRNNLYLVKARFISENYTTRIQLGNQISYATKEKTFLFLY